MRIHLIIDFMHLYYKYKFTIESGRIRRLTTDIDNVGISQREEVDISYVYYPLKEIEGFRRMYENDGNEVIISVCFDSKSKRTEIDPSYKSSRVSKLKPDDMNNIEVIKTLLGRAGYNTYWIAGMEADDIIANLINKYSSNFDFNIIYTNDTDILVNVRKGVGVGRYKIRKGYTSVGLRNFSTYCSEEFKCNIPYNGILLYKVLCGDKSDEVKGVQGFGPAAFNRFVDHIGNNIDWTCMADERYLTMLLHNSRDYLGDSAVEQALGCLELIKHVDIPIGELMIPNRVSSNILRQEAYGPFKMNSLIE